MRHRSRRALTVLAAAALAIPFAFVCSFIAGILLTPVLWKLEPVLGIELAGHSGPSDWVLWVLFAIFAITFFAIAGRVMLRGNKRTSPA